MCNGLWLLVVVFFLVCLIFFLRSKTVAFECDLLNFVWGRY